MFGVSGLKALTFVVQQDANLALQHQVTIIECLDHSDLMIKREVRHGPLQMRCDPASLFMC